MTTSTRTKTRPVVVTTQHKGVFFGHTADAPESTVVTVTDAQMCVYWSQDVHGILGLAATGPTRGCKVTPAVPKVTLQAVTAVMDATPEAAKAWEARPWA